jgi:hypothetical protein
MRHDKQGSALVLVLVIAGASGLVVSSLTGLAMTERRFNDDSRLIIEAKEAAEAAVECGFAQLVGRFQKQTAFPVNALSPTSGKPLVLTSDFYQLFQNGAGSTESQVRMPAYPYSATAPWGTHDTELIGGLVPPGEWKFIDGRVPGNEFDPLRDKLVFIREIEVLGKATVEDRARGYRYVAHVGQSLQIRDAPLFAHAIFYNMDMEIAPGPQMTVRGSVHSNGDMFIQAGNSLGFYRNVSATGRVYHGPNPAIPKSREQGGVTFPNGLGQQVAMKAGSNWIDSRMDDFASLASNRWNGNLQGYEHGIQKHNPVAIEDYVPDDPSTGANELRNYAYQIIQPLRSPNGLNTDQMEVERQKFSYKAGLVIHLEVPQVEQVVASLGANPDFNDIDVQKELLKVKSSGKDPTAQPVTVYRYDYSKNYEDIDFNNNGTPKIDPFNKIDAEDHFIRLKPYAASGSTVESGLYDHREKAGMNLVEVDIGKLKAAVEGNDKSYWGNAGKAQNNPSALPQNWWNGIVYLQVSTRPDPGRPDHVVPASENWGVKLVNGGKIPNPTDKTVFQRLGDDFGMTFATNAPLYVQGNYNADGKSNTGSSTEPDINDVTKEPPAALIADAVTILSNSWDDADSLKSVSSRRANSFTEVAAAILTGLVPSNKNGARNYSGGVENFPRFLEDWRTTFRYRGSMVALFESEAATGHWKYGNPIYTAPTRDWGFNSLFGQGYFPPGTPNTRTFRRINYRNLSAAEYAAALAALDQAF